MTPPNSHSGDTPQPRAATGPAGQLEGLAEDLSNLRAHLEAVDYRAAVLRLLIGADDQRHLDIASTDLDVALTRFRSAADTVVHRAAEAGAAFGVRPEERTLAVIAERAPDAWRDGLREQTAALAEETATLRERLRSDTGLVNSGQRQVDATLQLLLGDDEEPVTYEPKNDSQARLVDHLA